jgi:hypothetical protein
MTRFCTGLYTKPGQNPHNFTHNTGKTMTAEFDDLFSTEAIARSKTLIEGWALLNQSGDILDHIVSGSSGLPPHSGSASDSVAEPGQRASARMPAGAGYEPATLDSDSPLEKLMDESGTQELLNSKPLVSRHFEPVVRMVAELRAHPDIAKLKDRPGFKECWPDIVQAALEYVEQEVGRVQLQGQ